MPQRKKNAWVNQQSKSSNTFQVWLKYGNEDRPPPEQLPIVLQVLLSQAHRLKALDLLGQFLDLGPWAVNLALSVGIFPYVLRLLQSTARELRHAGSPSNLAAFSVIPRQFPADGDESSGVGEGPAVSGQIGPFVGE